MIFDVTTTKRILDVKCMKKPEDARIVSTIANMPGKIDCKVIDP